MPQPPTGALACLTESLRKSLPIFIISIDGLALITTIHHDTLLKGIERAPFGPLNSLNFQLRGSFFRS
jgi:hypothetical protein